jgi:hypothetical protein
LVKVVGEVADVGAFADVGDVGAAVGVERELREDAFVALAGSRCEAV